MSLKACKECGGQVRVDGSLCPHYEKNKPTMGMNRWVAALVLFGVALLGGLFSTTSSRGSAHYDSSVSARAHVPSDSRRGALSGAKRDLLAAKGGFGAVNASPAAESIASRGPEPVASDGYLNTSALTTHTSSAFNSTGATTLVAFVGTHTVWLSRTVAISGFTDSVGNTWTLLAGPAAFNGARFPLLGAVYYCNSPAMSVSHSVTVTLSNPAPLVVQTYAVSGTDGTSRPLVSAIADPGAGNISTSVASTSISVPAHTLLLSWVKTEGGAAATPGAGWYRDSSVTSHLTPAHVSNVAATSYASSFTLSSANGWQTAIVGLTPRPLN
jgi:hypothetical protein